MQTQEIFGMVQNRARLPDLESAMRATRATLETLSERLGQEEARHLGAQLPREIGRYLTEPRGEPAGERFDSDEFLARIAKREGVDLPESVHHARAVLEVVGSAVSEGEMDDVRDRLPDDYNRLFAGSSGKMPAS